MVVNELRSDAVTKLHQLIDGEVSAEEAARWADTVYFADRNQSLIESSQSLAKLFDDLSMASSTHSEANLMFDNE